MLLKNKILIFVGLSTFALVSYFDTKENSLG